MKRAGKYWVPDTEKHMIGALEQQGGFGLSDVTKAVVYDKRRTLAIDVGAHIGDAAIHMAKKLGYGHVIAIEPARDTYECLVRNVIEHDARNVTTLNIALGDQMEWLGIPDYNKDPRNTGARHVSTTEVPYRVLCLCLDWLPDLAPSFLHVDVQGYEVALFRGARRTLVRHKPVIKWEDAKGWPAKHGFDQKDAWDILAEMGARELATVRGDRVWGWP